MSHEPDAERTADRGPGASVDPAAGPACGPTSGPIPGPTIDKTLLLIHQHTHVATGAGIGAHRMAVSTLRMATDHFARVVSLTPVRGPEPGEEAAIHFYPANVESKVLHWRRIHEPRLRAALLQLASVPAICREVARADVVYVRFPHYPAFIASAVAWLAGKPMMVSVHSSFREVLVGQRGDRPWWRALGTVVEGYQRLVARRAVLALATGAHTRRLARPDAHLLWQHQVESGDLHRRDDTCQSPPIRLLYVGLLAASKGTDCLLDAAAALVRDGLDCRLTLVGPESGFDAAREVSRRGLDDRVTRTGFVPWGQALFEHYRQSDVFVFPSLSEGMPRAPMEALGQSVPVVATPPGTSSYIEHETSGLLVPVGDAAALAAAIRRVVTDGALRRRLIAGGFAVAEQHTRDRMYSRMRDLLTGAFGAAAL